MYLTDHFAHAAQDILDHLGAELLWVTDWAGTVGVAIAAGAAEYWDEPALAVMLCDLPSDQYRVFQVLHRWVWALKPPAPWCTQTPPHPTWVSSFEEMATRTGDHYLFGGLTSNRTAGVQIALSGNGNVKGGALHAAYSVADSVVYRRTATPQALLGGCAWYRVSPRAVNRWRRCIASRKRTTTLPSSWMVSQRWM